MRMRLLMASVVDKVLYALNMKTQERVTNEADARRIAMIGDESSINEQTLAARAFAEEVATRL